MPSLLARLRGDDRPARERSSFPQLSLSDYETLLNQFSFGGISYPFGLQTTYQGVSVEEPSPDLPGHAALIKACPPAFAAQMVRAMVLSQARFTFRNRQTHKQFGARALDLLERPWPNATTGELISRMEWHAGLQGNAYVLRQPGRLRVLRPDWVTVVYTSDLDPDSAVHELDAELAGYVYTKGGLASGNPPRLLLPDEVAHWSPIPDPESPGVGMSWFTPAVREAMGDRAVTEHKLRFFQNGATPNLVVKGVKAASKEQFDEIVGMLREQHEGLRNAYKTLFLTEGADATVVGSNLRDLDLKATQGSFETRVAYLSRVPAVVLSIAEGMQGSSLNAGNYAQARRNFADTFVYSQLQDMAAALGTIVATPRDAELWFSTSGMPFMRQDERDAAEIEKVKATTITMLIRDGFTPKSAVAAVMGEDMGLLEHTGLTSVQLQEPGQDQADGSSDPGLDAGGDDGGLEPVPAD